MTSNIIENEEMCYYSDFVAMLLQDYEPNTYQVKFEKFEKKYQFDKIFAQIVWSVCNLDKNKNRFDELIKKAIPGSKQNQIIAPIEKVNKEQFTSKKIMKLKRKLVTFNFKFDFDDNDDEEFESIIHPEPVQFYYDQNKLLYSLLK